MQLPLADPVTEPSAAAGAPPARAPGASRRSRRLWLGLLLGVVLASLAAILWLFAHKYTRTTSSLPLSKMPAETAGVLRLKGTTQAGNTRAIQAPLLAGGK